MDLTILMPCLNEAETIGRCVEKAQQFLRRSALSGEVLVADNGSSDGSREIARSKGARVVQTDERGYGAALMVGIREAKGRFVIMGDSDDSYDFSNLDPFWDALNGGADLVIGNRFLGGIAPNAMPLLHRYLGNPVLSLIGRIFFRAPVWDFHCGLRGFSRGSVLKLGLTSPGMEFASEMVIKAVLFGFRIEEVPTTLSPDGRSRPPHLNTWRDGWRHLRLLLTFAPHWLFLYPGLALFIIGLALFSVLMFGPIALFGVRLDVAGLIFAVAALLTGAQLLAFFALAQLHYVSQSVIPATYYSAWLSKYLTVDRACMGGAFLVVIGVFSAIYAVAIWAGRGLGDLDAGLIARPATLAVVGLALGAQLITTGFLRGILESRSKPQSQGPHQRQQ